MCSLHRRSNTHEFNKVQNDIVDITVRVNRLETSAILKATALKSDVVTLTLGPNCSQEGILEYDNDSGKQSPTCVFTSTPNHNSTKNVVNSETQLKHECNVSKIESNHIDKSVDDLGDSSVNENTPSYNESSEKRLSGLETTLRVKYSELKNKSNKIGEGLEVKRSVLQKEKLARDQKIEDAAKKQLTEQEMKLKTYVLRFSQSNQLQVKKLNETTEKLKELERQYLHDEKEKQKRLREQKLYLDQLHQLQLEYRIKYQQLHDITKKCKNSKEFLTAVAAEVPKLKTVNEQFDIIIEKCKTGDINVTDINIASNLVSRMSDLQQTFIKHSDILNKQMQKVEQNEKKAIKEKENVHMEAEEKGGATETPAQSGISDISDCVDRESLAMHLKLKTFLENYEQSLEALINDDKMKKFRFDCQKAVNVPVNAISPLNSVHLEDKLYRLSRLLQGHSVQVGNGQVSASSHGLGIKFCTNLLAKKFVRQGEHTVSSKPEAAFAIAAVIVALWVSFPDFGKLLLAHFQRTCPYLIPAFMPQVEGQSNEDYYRMLGYLYSDDGKVEPQDKFLKRMSGVMRLYAAILITPLRRGYQNSPKTHPIGLRESWRWLAASLNLEPRPDISATLIFDFLEITGSAMYQNYGKQFQKILLLICKEYFPRIEKVTPEGCGGPVCRLKAFLERILKEGRIPSPDGALPHNFW